MEEKPRRGPAPSWGSALPVLPHLEPEWGRKGQRGGAMCLKLHSLLSVSTQLLGTVSSALHPGVHTPKLQPQP